MTYDYDDDFALIPNLDEGNGFDIPAITSSVSEILKAIVKIRNERLGAHTRACRAGISGDSGGVSD